jgi:hypothetical protein
MLMPIGPATVGHSISAAYRDPETQTGVTLPPIRKEVPEMGFDTTWPMAGAVTTSRQAVVSGVRGDG